MDARQTILDNGYEDVIIFENPNYASALIGVSEDNRAVYDFDLMVESLMAEDDMSSEEAADFICFNAIGSLGFENAPIVMYALNKEE